MKTSIETIQFHGIDAVRLNGPQGTTVTVSLLGGQVLSWMTQDGRERLFLSERAVFDGSVAIRGGIPVCFPQFSNLGDLPKHGLLRTKAWKLNDQRHADDFALVTLEISDDEETRAIWPHPFRAEITIMLEADRLDLEFCVENTGSEAFEFTGALHTYLRMTQVEDVSLEGLYGHDYRDAANGDVVIRETGTELRIDRETDRIYHNIKRPQLLQAANLSLAIHSQGYPDVVIWNPWVDQCAKLKDMAPDGWRHMLCVEAAAARKPVSLPVGEEWYGRQTLVVV